MPNWRTWPKGPWLIALSFITLEVSAAAFGPYGWFIDELYYRACATRLAWGFVDHPPLSVALFAASRLLFGDSLVVLRLWPALGMAGAALSSSALCARLGGGRWARLLAAACVLSSPAAFVMGSFFSMNAFEPLLWSACALLFIDALERGGSRWLGVGALLGVAVLNKHTSVTFGVALVVGSLFTPARLQYRTRWPWLGALLAASIILPNLLWQMSHGWPSLEFYEQAQRLKNIPTPALKVLTNQLLISGPAAAPIAILGVWALLRDRARPASFALGAGFLALLAALMLSHSSRSDRLLGYYPIVFAAGAAAFERALRARWLQVLALSLLVASAALFLPIALPVLAPERAAAYATALGVVPQVEKNRSGALPQWLADRLSWPDFVTEVAAVYRSLPPEEQAHALLFSPSYGEAGALEFWGPKLGLPPVLSNHNTYYLWSRRFLEQNEPAELTKVRQTVWISVGLPRELLEHAFERVEQVGAFRCEYCVDWRRDRAISVARLPRAPLQSVWPALQHFE